MTKTRRAQARLGILLIGIVLLAGGAVLPLTIADYWSHSKVETYKGYEVDFFPGPGGLYGVYKTPNAVPSVTTTFDASKWSFYMTQDAAHLAVDEMIVPPTENFLCDYTHNGYTWKIYSTMQMGQTLYFSKDANGATVPGNHTTIESLEAYLNTLTPTPPADPVIAKMIYFSPSRIIILIAGFLCLCGYYFTDPSRKPLKLR